MQPLDIIVAERDSLMTLRTVSFPGDFVKYMVVLKRFSASGGEGVAAWDGADVEGTGIAATLDDANGFEILIMAKTKLAAPTKMRVDLEIGKDYRFDYTITIPPDDIVGWSVVMKDLMQNSTHDLANGVKYGLCGDALWWQERHSPAAPTSSNAPHAAGSRRESDEAMASSKADRSAVAGGSPRTRAAWNV